MDMTCNLSPHLFSSLLYFQPTSPLPTHHNTTIDDFTGPFMEGNAINTNLNQANDASVPLEIPRVQETHQNFQKTQTAISTQQEQDSESKVDSNCSSSNAFVANHHAFEDTEVHAVEETSSGRGGDVAEGGGETCGRERLKRHRVEVAGRVWIPEIWGQEELLKDWIDCNAFDATVVTGGFMSARASLIQEGRRSNSRRLRIENRC